MSTGTGNCTECGRPLGDLEAAGKVGTAHPHTSYKAAVAPRFATQRYRVLEVLRDFGQATTAAIADEMRMSRNQTATRVGELREGGYVTFVLDEDGKVACLPTGPSADGRVLQLTPAGLYVLASGGTR